MLGYSSTPLCDQKSTTTRLRAQLGATRTVSYGSGCRLDLIEQGENTTLLDDHNEPALPGHTFTQKASILFEASLSIILHRSPRLTPQRPYVV